jgi:hypothetical protein
MKQGLYILSLILTTITNNVFAQDTVRYNGILKGFLLYESIELYTDGTFKWTSEYDLSWSEYGLYKVTNETLLLNYYPGINKISKEISVSEKPIKVEEFEIYQNKLYLLDQNGHRIKKRKDKSIKTKWSWIYGNRHKYEIKKIS